MPARRIVIGVDGSPEAAHAAGLGLKIAQQAGATCHLVHAAPDYWTGVTEYGVDVGQLDLATLAHAREFIVESLRSSLPDALLKALEVRIGRGPLVISELARELDAELVVLGGKKRRALARIGGSTVTHLVRMGGIPVLATDGECRAIRRVLVAADLSYAAAPAIEAARRWAGLLDAELRLLHVVEPMPVVPGVRLRVADEQVFKSCRAAVECELQPLLGPDADVVIRRGRPAAAITSEVRQWGADLVVVGSHGKGWVDRLLIGSTSERLLNVLPASLLVVPVTKPADLQSEGRIAMPWGAAAV